MVVDPRLTAARAALARQQQQTGTGVRTSPVAALQQQAAQMAKPQAKPGSQEDWNARFKAAAQQSGVRPADQPKGAMGVLGKIVNNPVVSTALKPLQLLDVPGRTLKSTINEVADVFNGGDASFDDWKSQIRDEEFGFGDMTANTGNKWLDRAIGFAGDVALDPLTYLSFGSGKLAGSSGRALAAAELISKGHLDDGAKVGRLGVSAADDALRKSVLGIDSTSLKFLGNDVPGTAGAGRAVGQTVNKARAAVMDTAVGRRIARGRDTDEVARAMNVLNGRAPGDLKAAAGVVKTSGMKRIARGTIAARHQQAMRGFLKIPQQDRVALTHAAEMGVPNAARQFDDALFNDFVSAGATGVKRRRNHVAHIMTREGRDALDKLPSGKVSINTTQSKGAAFERVWQAGKTYDINGQQVRLNTGTIAEINEKIGGALGGVKVLEDDFAKIAQTQLAMTAEDIGTAYALRELTQQMPDVVKSYEEIKRFNPTGSWTSASQDGFVAAAKAGQVGPRVKQMIEDGWEVLDSKLFAAGDEMLVRPEYREMVQRVINMVDDSEAWAVVDKYTQFFKTYATLSPGFHFRNLMSATFMNYADGVKTADMADALGLWKQFRDDPDGFINGLPYDSVEGQAFRATFGSGAGGHFSVAELGEHTMVGKATNNPVTRASRIAGEWVEGPVRLAMALNTIKGGADEMAALQRITRIHFDYSQVSQFDRKMKRMIPFWTWMSRNLPLQLQQMWLKPRAYAHYEALKNNFDITDPDDVVPSFWEDQGAFQFADGWFAMPDLPHTRLGDQAGMVEDPLKFLANFNPVLRVPGEMVANRKAFTGNEFYEDESKLLYALTNMVPAAAQVDRLSGGKITGAMGGDTAGREDKQLASLMGYLGIPVKNLTDLQIQQELARRSRQQ